MADKKINKDKEAEESAKTEKTVKEQGKGSDNQDDPQSEQTVDPADSSDSPDKDLDDKKAGDGDKPTGNGKDQSSAKLKKQVEKEKDKFVRLFAEFENYKRRTAKERMDLYKTAGEELMVALLPVLDDFDRALAEINKSTDDSLASGVNLIRNKLYSTMEAKGLEPMELEKGDKFNPDNHEAVTQIPAPSDDLKGKIVDVVEKGYKMGEKIIRHPKVVIGQK